MNKIEIFFEKFLIDFCTPFRIVTPVLLFANSVDDYQHVIADCFGYKCRFREHPKKLGSGRLGITI